MPGILMKKRLMDPLSRTKIFIEKEGRNEGRKDGPALTNTSVKMFPQLQIK
jgi:hypothetical protein